jgi:hypothetical protein
MPAIYILCDAMRPSAIESFESPSRHDNRMALLFLPLSRPIAAGPDRFPVASRAETEALRPQDCLSKMESLGQ